MNAMRSEWYLIEAADATDISAAKLTLALDCCDRDTGVTIGEYSHAAATTGQVREIVRHDHRIPAAAGRKAIDRAERAEAQALDNLTEDLGQGERPSRVASARRLVVGRLRQMGVRLATDHIGCARELATLIRTGRGLRAAIQRRNQGLNHAAADLDDMLADVRQQLHAAGVPTL